MQVGKEEEKRKGRTGGAIDQLGEVGVVLGRYCRLNSRERESGGCVAGSWVAVVSGRQGVWLGALGGDTRGL